MKKSQRLRLATLQAKDAATLSAEEKSELATLTALAAANPDASKDEDDTQAAAAAKPLDAAGFMARLTAAFRAKESLAAELAAAQSTIAQLRADLATATTAKTTAEGALTTANSAKATAEGALATATATLGVLATALGIGAADLATKEKAQAAFNARVDAHATDRLASLGFPSSGLPPVDASGASTGDNAADLFAQYNAMPCANPEQSAAKAAFFAKNEKQIRKEK